MIVGVDMGGWIGVGGASADITAAVKQIRTSSSAVTEASVGGLAENGITIATVIFGTGGEIGTISATEMATKIVEYFKKYGKGGTFWIGKSYGDKGGQYFELLNEPGNPFFWTDAKTGGPVAYIALIKKVHEELVANFSAEVRPKMLISWDGGYGGDTYGEELLAKEPKLKELVDGVTVHPYGGTGERAKASLGGRERVTKAWSDFGVPVFITEVGWSTDVGAEPAGASLQYTEAEQEANIKSFYKFCFEKAYVSMVIYFNFVDYEPNNYFGIETRFRVHKISFAVMAELRAKYEEGGETPPPPEEGIPIGKSTGVFATPNITSCWHQEAFQYTALETKEVKELLFRTNGIANPGVFSLCLGIAEDSGGKPGTVLGYGVAVGTEGAEKTIPINTWIKVTGFSIPVVTGTKYWLIVLPLGTTGKQLHYNIAKEGGGEIETKEPPAFGKIETTVEWGVASNEGPAQFYGVAEPVERIVIGSKSTAFSVPLANKTSCGHMESFQFTGLETKAIHELLFRTNNIANPGVTGVILGVAEDNEYEPGKHRPGAIMGQATAAGEPAVESWIKVVVAPINIVAGTKYWLMMLPIGEAGKLLHYNTGNEGLGEQESVKATYAKLEASTEWTVGNEGPVAFYGAAEAEVVIPPAKIPVIKQRLSRQAMFRSAYR